MISFMVLYHSVIRVGIEYYIKITHLYYLAHETHMSHGTNGAFGAHETHEKCKPLGQLMSSV